MNGHMIGNKRAAILTAEDAANIKKLIAERNKLMAKSAKLAAERARVIAQIAGLSNEAIGEKYEVSRWTIASIAAGKNWKTVA